MATCVELAGVRRADFLQGQKVPPLEGNSLLPIFQGKECAHSAPIFWEHEGNRAVRLGSYKLVSRNRRDWELYDLNADRTELHNLASRQPEKVREMAALYDAWAKRCEVVPPDQLPAPRHTVPAKVPKETAATDQAADK